MSWKTPSSGSSKKPGSRYDSCCRMAGERLKRTLQILYISKDHKVFHLNFTHCVFCMFFPIPFHPLSELSVHRLEEGRKTKPPIKTSHVNSYIAVKGEAALTVFIDPQGFFFVCLVWGGFAINAQRIGRQTTTVVLFPQESLCFTRAKSKLGSSSIEVTCYKQGNLS